MNKHGFTLTEVLAAIVIIAIIAGIGTVAYTNIIKNVNNKVFEQYRDSMHAEAIYYVTNYSDKINWIGNNATISLAELKMDKINNPNDASDLCENSYVNVTKTRNTTSNVLSITYNVCLKCNDYDECMEYKN